MRCIHHLKLPWQVLGVLPLLLVDHGADCNAPIEFGGTPLDILSRAFSESTDARVERLLSTLKVRGVIRRFARPAIAIYGGKKTRVFKTSRHETTKPNDRSSNAENHSEH